MEGFLTLCLIVGIVVFCVKKSKQKKLKEEENKRQLEEDKERQIAELNKKWEDKKREFAINGLPILEIETLNLSKGEVCHFMGDGYFCKLKQQVVGYEGGSRGVSIRVMKGMSFRVGNHRGHYVKEDVTEKTNGIIYLTSKKIIFTAIKNSSTIKYEDIVNLNVADNMLQIQTQKKSYLFQVVDNFNFLVLLEFILNEKNSNKE